MKNTNSLSLKNNGNFVLFYRIGTFILITLGLIVSLRLFTDNPHPYALFTYTVQSNILVWIFFLVTIVKTIIKINSKENDNDYGFYSPFSFAVCIAIIVTFLIFWLYLAPTGWTQNKLLSFKNLTIHFFCPVLMVLDRILFYQKGSLKKSQVFYMLIFPYAYVIQSFVLGLTRAVWFSPVGVESYYIYPFLDLDAYGPLVFVFLFLLTGIFLGISFLWYHLETEAKKQP